MKLKNFLSVSFLFLCLASNLFSEVYSSQQSITAGHWIYDALYSLSLESGKALVIDNAPLTVSELELVYYSIDKNDLSDTGVRLCNKIEEFFSRKSYLFNFQEAKFTSNIILNPVGTIRTNTDVDWSYATSYTNNCDYASNTVPGSSVYEPLLTMPFILDFGEIVYINVDTYAGAGPFWALTSDFYSINVPTGTNGAEFFMWPLNGDASIGYTFNNWGINLHVGRQGLEIGKTRTGSIVYNHTFETDFYSQLNVYNKNLRYLMAVSQIDQNRFFYLHSAEIVPFSWLKLGIVEGTLIDSSFEIRYLNPLLFMHSYSGWNGYKSKDEFDNYGEAHYCAYFGLSFDIVPCKNLRIYGLYSQNEIQSLVELTDDYSKSYPDSFGFQMGVELFVPDILNGSSVIYLEGIYTTPFHYLKQTKNASLCRVRNDINSFGLGDIASWIGTPFGPDSIGFETGFTYDDIDKFKLKFNYLFLAHGTNSFGLFNKRTGKNNEFEGYYPSVIYKHNNNPEETIPMARAYSLTETIQYTNKITLGVDYNILRNLQVGAETSYLLIFNNHSEAGYIGNGFEGIVYMRYEMF